MLRNRATLLGNRSYKGIFTVLRVLPNSGDFVVDRVAGRCRPRVDRITERSSVVQRSKRRITGVYYLVRADTYSDSSASSVLEPLQGYSFESVMARLRVAVGDGLL